MPNRKAGEKLFYWRNKIGGANILKGFLRLGFAQSMRLSGTMLPIHFGPLVEESLSSWMTRLALHHHQIPSSFFKFICRTAPDAFKQDIDVRCPPSVLQSVSVTTGKSFAVVRETTFEPLLNHIYLHNPDSTALPRWIGPAYIRRTSSHHFGLRICPACLQESPHILLLWRCTFMIACIKHGVRLIDRCQFCGYPKSSRKLFPEHLKSFPKDALCYCHNCGWDYRAGPCITAKDFETDAVEDALRLLRFGAAFVGPREVVFSHLVFDGWRLIMNGVVRLARKSTSVTGRSLELPVLPVEKHAELEFHSVDTTAGLLAVAYELLQQWPDRFLEFSRANQLSRYDWVRPRESAPYWLHRVLKSELDMTRYSVTAEEIRGAKVWLEKSGGQIKARDIISALGVKSRPRMLSGYLNETAAQNVEVDKPIEWIDSVETFKNIGIFVIRRTRAYMGLMLITPLTHKQLCHLIFDHTVSDHSSFARWIYGLGVRNSKRCMLARVTAWYFSYISERFKIEERLGTMPSLFCTSSGGAMNVSLAIKSISRCMKFSDHISIYRIYSKLGLISGRRRDGLKK